MRSCCILRRTLWVSFYLSAALGQSNVTVDDDNSAIQYSSGWSRSNPPNSLNYGSYHQLTNNPADTASFSFTGTGIYFMSPLWPYAVAAVLSLDDGSAELVDLQDYQGQNINGQETVNTAVVWGKSSLSNSQHTLRISFAEGKEWLVVDALIYTTQDGTSTSSNNFAGSTQTSTGSSTGSATRSSSSSTGSSTAVSVTSSSTSNNTLPIALGTALGVAAVLLVALILLLYYQKKKRDERAKYAASGTYSSYPTSFVGSGFIEPSAGHQSMIAPTGYAANPSVAPPHGAAPAGLAGVGAWAPNAMHHSQSRETLDSTRRRPSSTFTTPPGAGPIRMSWAGEQERNQYETVMEYNPYAPQATSQTSLPGPSSGAVAGGSDPRARNKSFGYDGTTVRTPTGNDPPMYQR